MLTPIETQYRGYRFRSRLEARWAVFFDACGADWEYEPEGYVLSGGLRYLPDFLLHGVGGVPGVGEPVGDLYVEVKGRMTERDARKIRGLGEPVLVLGRIPDGRFIDEIRNDTFGPMPGVGLDGRFRLYGEDIGGLDIPRTVEAYRRARQARFEHGEARC